MRMSEATEEEMFMLKLWDKWVDEVTSSTEKPDRNIDVFISSFKEAGIPAPKRESPLVFMWLGFLGG